MLIQLSSGSNVYMWNNWYKLTSSGSTSYNGISSSYISADDWHYWACTYNGSYAAIYCDGVLVCYTDGLSQTLNSNDNKLYIYSGSSGNYDEIRISNSARSADEIKAYYDCAKDKIEQSIYSLIQK